MASLLATRTDTVLWAREPEVVAGINADHRNEAFLPGYDLPPELVATGDLEAAMLDRQIVIVAVPSLHLRGVAEAMSDHLTPDMTVISLVKGIEADSRLRPTQVLNEVFEGHDPNQIGVLSGPNLAREVMAGHPSATVVAIGDEERARDLQQILSSDTFRVYTNRDVVGCEIGGAVKNVLAIAAGMTDGMGYGMNTRAALLTRGLAELARMGIALGGEPLTFLGLAGNGDLIATCSSTESRNHRVGEALAAGQSVEEIVAGTASVAEGVRTAPAVLALAAELGVEMPICSEVDAVLAGRTSPADALVGLMRRDLRSEHDGLDR